MPRNKVSRLPAPSKRTRPTISVGGRAKRSLPPAEGEFYFSPLRFLPTTHPPPLSASRDSPAYSAIPASPVLGDVAVFSAPPSGLVSGPPPCRVGISVSLRSKPQTVHSSCFDPVSVAVAAFSTFHTKVWDARSFVLAYRSGQSLSVHWCQWLFASAYHEPPS